MDATSGDNAVVSSPRPAELNPHSVSLLCYADRLGGSLQGLRETLERPPFDCFDGVHILPFFTPFDGDDAGFDPIDHATVDPRLGTWDDVRALADSGFEITADLIVNHMSSSSTQFLDWVRRGADSPFDGLFLTFDRVFPQGAAESDITAFYRPRSGLPFTPFQLDDGSRRLVWTTFMPSQVDIDVQHPSGREYIRGLLRTLAEGGVSVVRLDAVGYAVKSGTEDSFMTQETLDFISDITEEAHGFGLRVLVEVHAHYRQQLAVSELVDLVYDFATPPLILHSLATGTVERLQAWLDVRPSNSINVLDTHDGIGVIDAGPRGDEPGFLDQDEMRHLFDRAAILTEGRSAKASTSVAWAALPHQINATFFSVLGADPTAYILARAIQLMLPGEPQIYYVGHLAGEDDMALFQESGQGRDVNRHRYSDEEVVAAADGLVTRAIRALIHLRRTHPAFEGDFSHAAVSAHELALEWRSGADEIQLQVAMDPQHPAFSLTCTNAAGGAAMCTVEAVAASLED